MYQLCIADKSLESAAELKDSGETITNQHNIHVTVKIRLVHNLLSSPLVFKHLKLVIQISCFICVWNMVCHREGEKHIGNLVLCGFSATSIVW